MFFWLLKLIIIKGNSANNRTPRATLPLPEHPGWFVWVPWYSWWQPEILRKKQIPNSGPNIPLFTGFYTSKRWLALGFLNHRHYGKPGSYKLQTGKSRSSHIPIVAVWFVYINMVTPPLNIYIYIRSIYFKNMYIYINIYTVYSDYSVHLGFKMSLTNMDVYQHLSSSCNTPPKKNQHGTPDN